MEGLYLVIGIFIATLVFLAVAAIKPKLKKYRVEIKAVEPQKKHVAKRAHKKKRKSVWVKVI